MIKSLLPSRSAKEALPTKPAAEPLSYSPRRITAVAQALGARRYLEIGVNEGATFVAVDMEERTAVDPIFRFDWKKLQNANTRFFEVTSDKYFTEHAPAQPFDVMFLDGLHTFEQVFRDFCSSLSCCHDRTVWLIDDTGPTDVFSVLPTPAEAHRYRHETANKSLAWHGDVYKVVFAIHDFFPMLSYCTINTGGNPQTLVWKQPRANFTPKFNSLEAISRLTYFDFRRHEPLMRHANEKDALAMVIDHLQSVKA